jgi:hypothetical protein
MKVFKSVLWLCLCFVWRHDSQSVKESSWEESAQQHLADLYVIFIQQVNGLLPNSSWGFVAGLVLDTATVRFV